MNQPDFRCKGWKKKKRNKFYWKKACDEKSVDWHSDVRNQIATFGKIWFWTIKQLYQLQFSDHLAIRKPLKVTNKEIQIWKTFCSYQHCSREPNGLNSTAYSRVKVIQLNIKFNVSCCFRMSRTSVFGFYDIDFEKLSAGRSPTKKTGMEETPFASYWKNWVWKPDKPMPIERGSIFGQSILRSMGQTRRIWGFKNFYWYNFCNQNIDRRRVTVCIGDK